MTYTWDEIEHEWLDGGVVALPPETVLEAFNRVEVAFGREWIEETRTSDGIRMTGSHPTLSIAHLGVLMDGVVNLVGGAALVEKVRRHDDSARAELAALHIVTSGVAVTTELEPPFTFEGRERKADFRVCADTQVPWTYVEVSQPNRSEQWHDLDLVVREITALAGQCEGRFAVEVVLERDPTPQELIELKEKIVAGSASAAMREELLDAALGSLYWNETAPGFLEVKDRGEEYTARISGASTHADETGPVRHVMCRCAFSDDRARRFLQREAAQLPSDVPGLIMLQTSGAPGALKRWGDVILAEFEANRWPWVSAVVLFSSGSVGSPLGEAVQYETVVESHPHATHQLPTWIVAQVSRFVRPTL